MATLLDVSILDHFGGLFVVFLVFVVVFGILEAVKPFGSEKKGLHGLLALFIAFLFLISGTASAMIGTMIPWFIVLIIFLFFVMLMFRMFGVDDNQFKKVVEMTSVYPWIIIFSILVLIAALSAVFGQQLLSAGTGVDATTTVTPGGTVTVGTPTGVGDPRSTSTSNFGTNLMNTLRHPKILGLVFVMLTGAFVMIFLTRPAKP